MKKNKQTINLQPSSSQSISDIQEHSDQQINNTTNLKDHKDGKKINANIINNQQQKKNLEHTSRNKRRRIKKNANKYVRQLRREYTQVQSKGYIKTGLQAFLGDRQMDMGGEIKFENIIHTGEKRKLKKKIKKLKKLNISNEQIFDQVVRSKKKIQKTNNKTIFNQKSELKQRRKKRMKKIEANRIKQKKQILHKKL